MISSSTKTVGLIGNPVEHSISPSIHNSAFEDLGLDYVYLTFQVEEEFVEEALNGIKSLEIEGVNVTIPHKSKVMKYLDEINETAKKIGAVNTIKRKNHRLKGFNTDGEGVLRALREKIDKIEKKNILLLGAGGAARAIAFKLTETGANLTISNRTGSKAKNLAEEIEKVTGKEIGQIPQEEDFLQDKIEDSDILINSTSVGMHPNVEDTIVESDLMCEDLTVMDIVYNPPKTRLLKEAEKAGADTISGLGMLVHQGAASFEIWTGKKAPVETMRKSAKKAIEEENK